MLKIKKINPSKQCRVNLGNLIKKMCFAAYFRKENFISIHKTKIHLFNVYYLSIVFVLKQHKSSILTCVLSSYIKKDNILNNIYVY